MTMLYSKARELFDQDYKNSEEAKESQQAASTKVKRTRSGKLLMPFRKNKRK
ncbi:MULTISPECIES: hypothetical protein [Halobacillus]|uniref:Uncharacterized protein n=1 Tax=Halobacillus andaensis TaxID=1176239 RepID=A0A917BAN4_HALAA|nr:MULTISPECIES: hypothetical protein [Halobacillus]MBP2006305.1 hypothetical protein [Halobacillus andaensis]MCP3029344.1 hypothetical protein [Halobacillus sp. A5]GGF34137.1 hypothetical protein GCM10010954_36500 [Halobacillus andaensis]